MGAKYVATFGPVRGQHWAVKVLLIALYVAIPSLAFLWGEQKLAVVTSAYRDRAHARMLTDVHQASTRARDVLRQLRLDTVAFHEQVKQVTGTDLVDGANAAGLPKPLARCLLREASAREAWAGMIAGRLNTSDVSLREQRVDAAMAVATQPGQIEWARGQVDEALLWGNRHADQLKRHTEELKFIRFLLDAEAFESHGATVPSSKFDSAASASQRPE